MLNKKTHPLVYFHQGEKSAAHKQTTTFLRVSRGAAKYLYSHLHPSPPAIVWPDRSLHATIMRMIYY
jgi:hypothetical protein